MVKNKNGKSKSLWSLPLYDEKKHVWTYYNDDKLIINKEIYEAFSDIIKYDIEYHFEICFRYYDAQSDSLKTELKVCHAHNFNDVLENLYFYPESFNVPAKYQDEYTKKEYLYLNKLKNYLLLIGLKDKCDSPEYIKLQKQYKENNNSFYKAQNKILNKEALVRANNSLVTKYGDYNYIYASERIMEAIIKGEKKTRIYKQYENSESRIGLKFFVLNEHNDFKLAIEIIKEIIIPFKDLDAKKCDYKLNGFNSLASYKKYLFKEFNEDSLFNEEDLVSIVTFKIIAKY